MKKRKPYKKATKVLYQEFLENWMSRLIDLDPPNGTPEGDLLRRLALVCEDYEKQTIKLGRNSP